MSVNNLKRGLQWTILVILASVALASAQAVSSAALGGSVKDDQGGALPGVAVTATQTATGQVRTAITNESGNYILTALPVGPYRVEFVLQGLSLIHISEPT